MKDTSARIKIGVVTLVSVALFILMVLAISRLTLKPQREIRVDFSFINSLEVRAPVRFAGARVGEVKRIHVLTPDERAEHGTHPPYVHVYVSVDKAIAIPKETHALVNTMGFMGEKYLELLPESRSTTYLADNEPIEGVDPTPMDSVFASAKKLADDMQVAAKNMNTITVQMQDRLPVLIGELEKTLSSAQGLAVDAKRLTGDVQDMVEHNREEINHLLENARQLTIYAKSLSHVLATRPWKIIWGFGGPLTVEPEGQKFEGPKSTDEAPATK
jgi:phospholipid/cholesterol/gamma-HCH transport system substrate-binding protein